MDEQFACCFVLKWQQIFHVQAPGAVRRSEDFLNDDVAMRSAPRRMRSDSRDRVMIVTERCRNTFHFEYRADVSLGCAGTS
jgi:hypothetical protein